jgi:RimJ/RimL family protein N-acetyltransferase
MVTAPALTDGTVTLRAHREDDVQGLFEQCQDPVTQRWTTRPVPYTREHARTLVTRTMPEQWADGTSWAFAVEVEGRYAGTVSLRDEGERRVEVTFGSHPSVRGTGAMERAVRLLVDWGFADRGARVIIWRAHQGNWASRKLAWRLGFRMEGAIRAALPQHGHLHDAWVGTLLATDDRQPAGEWLTVPVIDGDGFRLRPWRESDVPRVVEACSDERTQTWLGTMPDPYGESEALQWFEHQAENRASGRAVAWAVADDEQDRALGSMSYFNYTRETELEIGFWAHPDARGRGVTTRAMGALLRYAFEDLGVRRVMAGAAVDNTASRHVIEANGLSAWGIERLGTVVRSGRADCVFYDLLIEEWRAAGAP